MKLPECCLRWTKMAALTRGQSATEVCRGFNPRGLNTMDGWVMLPQGVHGYDESALTETYQ